MTLCNQYGNGSLHLPVQCACLPCQPLYQIQAPAPRSNHSKPHQCHERMPVTLGQSVANPSPQKNYCLPSLPKVPSTPSLSSPIWSYPPPPNPWSKASHHASPLTLTHTSPAHANCQSIWRREVFEGLRGTVRARCRNQSLTDPELAWLAIVLAMVLGTNLARERAHWEETFSLTSKYVAWHHLPCVQLKVRVVEHNSDVDGLWTTNIVVTGP